MTRSIREIDDFLREQISTKGMPVTYGQLWTFISNGKPWNGRHCQLSVMKVLDDLIGHSVQTHQPLLSAAVTRKNGSVTGTAKQNFYNACQRHGCSPSGSTDDFFAAEQSKALAVQ